MVKIAGRKEGGKQWAGNNIKLELIRNSTLFICFQIYKRMLLVTGEHWNMSLFSRADHKN